MQNACIFGHKSVSFQALLRHLTRMERNRKLIILKAWMSTLLWHPWHVLHAVLFSLTSYS